MASGKYRRGRKRLLAAGTNLSDVPIGELWFVIRSGVWWLCSALLTLWTFNPFSVLRRRQRRIYYCEHPENLTIRPPWAEFIGDLFRSDETRKAKLLKWVQDMVPRLGVEDFVASWHDGLALCFLMEEVSPGLCPRPELLKPHHRVNNCRLGIRLAQKYLSLPKMMITAEEMAIADADTELKIMHLLQLIKWRYQRQRPRIPSSPNLKALAHSTPEPVKVIARGTGLKAGIVGRRAKFNILTESANYLDLHIEIQGPNNELNSERITSVNHGYDRRSPHARSPSGYPAAGEDDGKAKFIQDDVGNMFLRQKSIDEDLHQNVIPFDYQCVGEGRFLVTYIPRSSGTYFISIKSQEIDIEGSPFEVKISDWMSSWNVMPKPRVMSFDMLPSIEETPRRERSISPDSSKKKRDPKWGGSARNRMAQVSKQLTIMKKRVLKRVITRNGEEILLTPSPSLSRQSSADISDFSNSEDDQSNKGEGKRQRIGRSPGRSPGRRSPSPSPGRRSPNPSHGRRSPVPGNGRSNYTRDSQSETSARRVEDFADNSCNITLSVTSFEEEEEEKRKQKVATMRIRSISPVKDMLRTPIKGHVTEGSGTEESSTQEAQLQVDNAQNLPRFGEPNPRVWDDKTPQSPRHKSHALHGKSVTICDEVQEIGERERSSTERINDAIQKSNFLEVSKQDDSPSTSVEASANRSEVTDFNLSPRQGDFTYDFPDDSQGHERREFTRSASDVEENRRRFEESLSQRDNDADDSDAYSQLVSALTELKPSTPVTKKLVGRSYSDGSKVIAPAKERHFIRLTRLDGQGGDCFWSSGSSMDRDGASNHGSTSSWNSLRTKVLQSDSLRKTCMYLQDRALDHSINSSTECPPFPGRSQDLSPDREFKGQGEEEEVDEEEEEEEEGRDGEDAEASVVDARRERLAKFARQWRTFDADVAREPRESSEQDPDWRYTLQGKRSHSFHARGLSVYDDDDFDPQTFRPFEYTGGRQLEDMSILDKLNDDDEILEVVIESEEPPEASPETLLTDEDEDQEAGSCSEESLHTLQSKPKKPKGNLARQERLSAKSSSDASADLEKARPKAELNRSKSGGEQERRGSQDKDNSGQSNSMAPFTQLSGGRSPSTQLSGGRCGGKWADSISDGELQELHAEKERANLHRTQSHPEDTSMRRMSVDTSTSHTDTSSNPAEETDSRVFRTIQKQRRKSRETNMSVSIVVPKAKTSKSTQVSYEEIKAETGWKRPAVRVHRRKKYVYATDANGEALKSNSNSGNAKQNETVQNVKDKILYGRPSKNSNEKMSENSDRNKQSSSEKEHAISSNKILKPQNQENGRNQNDNASKKTKFRNDNPDQADDTSKERLIEHSSELLSPQKRGPQPCRISNSENKENIGEETPRRRERLSSQSSTTSTHKTDASDFGSPRVSARKTDRSGNGSRVYGRTRSEPVIGNGVTGRKAGHSIFFHRLGDAEDPRNPFRGHRGHGSRDVHVMEWMQRAARLDYCHPERQSTQDTLDSGIENESPNNYNSFVSGHRRIHRRPYPWSIDLDPSLIRGSNSSLSQLDSFSGHPRLARRSYPWDIELDPRLIRGSSSSVSTDGTPEDRFQLTLGVIEAAVHRTVNRILSGSSVSSNATRSHFSSFSHRGLSATGSYSDSELNYTTVSAGKRKKKRKPKKAEKEPAFTAAQGSFRSLGLLSNDLTIMRVRSQSPDINETKSDGQYSPYSVTDIPCFELPSDACKIKEDTTNPLKSVHSFPHQKGDPFSATAPSAQMSGGRSGTKLVRTYKSLDETKRGNIEQQKESSGFRLKTLTPGLSSKQTGNSSDGTSPGRAHNPLFLRRQREHNAKLSKLSSTEDESPSHERRSSKPKSAKSSFLTVEYDVESDTNTSEDSLMMMFGAQNTDRTTSQRSENTSPANTTTVESTNNASERTNPKIVIHHSAKQRRHKPSSSSTDDSYCGFGVSRSERDNLIDHLQGFKGLTEYQKSSSSPDGSRGSVGGGGELSPTSITRGLSPSSLSQGDISPESLRELTTCSPSYLTQYSDPFDDSSPVSPASLFASHAFFSEANLEILDGSDSNSGIGPNPSPVSNNRLDTLTTSDQTEGQGERDTHLGQGRSDMTLSPLQAQIVRGSFHGSSDVTTGTVSRDAEQTKEDAGQCIAYGAGLQYGQVGVKNNFQVWTERPGNGCLTVAVFGPRSHCVTETNVTYIGDNVYDVTFSVTSPGFYVIVVKWGEKNLPDSPYICKVTYQ